MTAPVRDSIHPAALSPCELPSRDGHSGYRILRVCCWLVAIALGVADAWATRFTMYPDGISYLDVGDAYWRGDWHNAINAYWSPLYPWILGFFLKVIKPSAYWEYPLVHLVNFLMYAAALVCFDVFLSTFVKQQEERNRELATQAEMGLPKWAWLVAGYSAFIVSSLLLITISFTSGDMAIAAVVYLVSALILRIRGNNSSWVTFVCLGLALGIGYLTKAVMFLMAIPFLLVAAAAQRCLARSMKPVALSFLAFVLIACPFALLLSKTKGRPTFGDSGKVNYEVNVNDLNFFIPQVQGPEHPVRRIFDLPGIYEYSNPIIGTYPLWYDPSYWHEGIKPHLDLRTQLSALLTSSIKCFWISLNAVLGLNITAAIFFLYLIGPSISRSFAYARLNWALWAPASAGIGLYSLVVIEPRYIAALFCLLWIVGFSGVRLPVCTASRRLVAGAVLVVAMTTCLIEGWQISRALNGSDFLRSRVATPVCWKLAAALKADGLRPGDKLAVIGDWLFPSEEAAYIARLARAQIISEARPDEFWTADASTRSRVVAEFASVGAKAILTYNPPQIENGWERLGDTDYYVYRLMVAK